MFRAPLCPSSGAQEYYTVVAACGISCCGFQVASNKICNKNLYCTKVTRVWQELEYRIDVCRVTLGAHTEHL